MRNFRLLLLLLLLIIPAERAYSGAPLLHIKDAWVKEGPPSLKVMAGYLSLENRSDQTLVITAIESPSFGSVMIHKSEIKKDYASMIPMKQLTIPPGGTVIFQPGGYHLMLSGPVKRLRSGDHVEFIIHYSESQKASVRAVVRKSAKEKEDHHNMGHEGH